MNQQLFEIARRIKMIHNTFDGNHRRSLSDFQLTFSQMEMLWYLQRNAGKIINQKEIEEAFHLTNPTVTGILGRLEEKKMVTRQVDQRDRRYRIVALAPKGEAVLRDVKERIHQIEEQLFGCLNEEETARLLELLDKVAEHATCERGEHHLNGCGSMRPE